MRIAVQLPSRVRSPLAVSIALTTLVAACDGSIEMRPVDAGPRGDAAVARNDAAIDPSAEAAASPDAAMPLGCEAPDPDTSSALSFDGVDDHVAMGDSAALGLATFTVEAWVRRDGEGSTAGTGVGGLTLVPIAGKGRGEDDGSNVDCNYAFGFFGDVLGADFEDMASGANHPVTGS